MKQRIGVIGVGLMGHGIAKNIVTKGWPLTYLRHPGNQPTTDLDDAGAQGCDSVAELADASDIIVLCVTGTPYDTLKATLGSFGEWGIKYAQLELKDGAIDYAAAQGATLLESYAVAREPGKKIAATELNMGAETLFAEAGFKEVARNHPQRPIMRLDLSERKTA